MAGSIIVGPATSESTSAIPLIEYRDVPKPEDEIRLGLVVGIDQYLHGIEPLRNAVNDANAIAHVLKRHHYEVEYLLDGQATLSMLRSRLAQLTQDLTDKHRVVIFLAGHGIIEKATHDSDSPGVSYSQAFFLPQDAHPGEIKSWWPMAELHKTLKQLPCRHLLAILDCCFAANVIWEGIRTPYVRRTPISYPRYQYFLAQRSRQVLTSTGPNEEARDILPGYLIGKRGSGNNSPFTSAVCEGLLGAADLPVDRYPPDGVITATELHAYVSNYFNLLSGPNPDLAQYPQLAALTKDHGGQFIFWVPDGRVRLPIIDQLTKEHNPYHELNAYTSTELDNALFFGRDESAGKLLHQVKRNWLTVILGESGSGKTSLLNVAVLRPLQSDPGWYVIPPIHALGSPEQVLNSLADALKKNIVSVLQERADPKDSDLLTAVGTKTLSLEFAVSLWCQVRPRIQLLIVIDPLDNLLTANEASQAAFSKTLIAACRWKGDQAHVVTTLWTAHEHSLKQLLIAPESDGADPRFILPTLKPKELREIIEGPAHQRLVFFEPPELVDEIIHEVEASPAKLPLLSVTLYEMFDRFVKVHPDDRLLKREDYEFVGRIVGSISKRAERVYQSLRPDAQRSLEYLIYRMIDPTSKVPRQVPDKELNDYEDKEEIKRIDDVIDKMLNKRLIVAHYDAKPEVYYEPVHAALLTNWERFSKTPASRKDLLSVFHRLIRVVEDPHQRTMISLWATTSHLAPIGLYLTSDPRLFNRQETAYIRRIQGYKRRFWRIVASLIGVILATLVMAIIYVNEKRIEAQAATISSAKNLKLADKRLIESNRQTAIAKAKELEAIRQTDIANVNAQEAIRQTSIANVNAQEAIRQKNIAKTEAANARSNLLSFLGHAVPSYLAQAIQLKNDPNRPDPLEAAKWDVEAYDAWIKNPTLKRMFPEVPFEVRDTMNLVAGAALTKKGCYKNGQTLAVYSPKGRYLMTLVNDRKPIILNLKKREDGWSEGTQLPSRITAAAFSPDESMLATVGEDGAIWLFTEKSGASGSLRWEPVIDRSIAHDGAISGIVWSSRNNLITAGHDGQVLRWAPQLYEEPMSLDKLGLLGRHEGKVNSVAIDPTGEYVVTASDDGSARIWPLEGGSAQVLSSGHDGPVMNAHFAFRNSLVVTAGQDGQAVVWTRADGRPLHHLFGNSKPLRNAIFSPDDTYVVAVGEGSSDDKTGWHIWNWRTEQPMGRIPIDSDGPIADVLASPLGSLSITTVAKAAAATDTLSSERICMIEFGGRQTQRLIKPEGKLQSVAYSPDGRLILAAGGDPFAYVWDAKTGKRLMELKGHDKTVNTARFNNRGDRIVTASEDDKARVWNLQKTGAKLTAMEGSVLGPHAHGVKSAAFSDDGKMIYTLDGMGVIRTFTLTVFSTWVLERTLPSAQPSGSKHQSLPFELRAVLSPNKRWLAATDLDGRAVVWDLASDKEKPSKFILDTKKAWALSMSWSHDSRRIVLGGVDGIAVIWNAPNWKTPAHQLVPHLPYTKDVYNTTAIYSVAWDRSGRRVLTAGADDIVRLWDARRGLRIHRYDNKIGISAAAFSPDGSRIVTADRDFVIKVWGIATEKPIMTLYGHSKQVADMAFTNDGRQLVSAGQDGMPQQWATESENRPPAALRKIIKQKQEEGGSASDPDDPPPLKAATRKPRSTLAIPESSPMPADYVLPSADSAAPPSVLSNPKSQEQPFASPPQQIQPQTEPGAPKQTELGSDRISRQPEPGAKPQGEGIIMGEPDGLLPIAVKPKSQDSHPARPVLKGQTSKGANL